MRKTILLGLILMLVFSVVGPAQAQDIKVFINGQSKSFEPAPFIENGRTLVPMRAFFESLGADVDWDGETRTVTGIRSGIEVKLQIGSTKANVNSQEKILDVPAKIISGRTFIPLRFVGEALGEKIEWEGATRTIRVASGSNDQNEKDLAVHFIDVGQGDAILVLSPNGSTMLIDAGPKTAGQKVVSYLKKAGITSIDLVVATHPHEDHIGGMQDVFSNFSVKKVIDSGLAHTSSTYENFLKTIDQKDIAFEIAKSGNKVNLDKDLNIDILHPGTTVNDPNNNSVVLKLTYEKTSFMLTGDAEKEAEEIILSSSKDLSAQILKVGHHGSSTSTSTAFLQSVKPEVAVIQVGTDNKYGHPTQETINKLNNSGVKIYRTDLQGDIIITSNGQSYSVNVQPMTIQPTPAPEPEPTPVPGGKININTASYEELQEITGVGPVIAQRIIDYRNTVGFFSKIEDIKKISGIGDATFEKMKNEITV